MTKRLTEGKLHELLLDLAGLMHQEVQMCRDEGIPMAAADKAVVLQLLKMNSITAEPDNKAVQDLRDAFSEDLEKRRSARAAALTAVHDEPLSGLLQ